MYTEPTKDQLNQFVLTQRGSLQQSWQWGELQERMGRPIRRFLFSENGKAAAAATFVRHDLGLGKHYWLCPKGPFGNFQFSIFNFQKELGGIFVRLEPTYKLQANSYKLVKAPKDHNPRATILVNLSRSEAELLAMMHPKTRYNIRLAQKKELGIRNLELGIEEFWELMRKTAKRDKFFLHPQRYYELLSEIPEIKIFGVHHEDELIAAAMVSFWGETATYLHGASDYEQRALMAPYVLHWEIIKQAKAHGLKYYDFGGVAPASAEALAGQAPGDHYLAGVTRFKSGWGGEYVEYPGSWDYVLDKFWYGIYKLARKVM